MKNQYYIFVLSVACICILNSSAWPIDQYTSDVQSLLDRHISNRDVIFSLSCNNILSVSQLSEDNKKNIITSQYIRYKEKVKIVTSSTSGVTAVQLLKDSKIYTYHQYPLENGVSRIGAGVRTIDGESLLGGDADEFTLTKFPIPDTPEMFALEKLTAKANKCELSNTSLDGKKVYKLKLYFDPSKKMDKILNTENLYTEIFFDPQKNYICVKWRTNSIRKSGQERIRNCEATDFFEYEKGNWLAVKLKGYSLYNGKKTNEWVSEVSNIIVNKKINDEAFAIKYAEGTPFFDHIKNVYYKVNSAGSPISEVKAYKGAQISSQQPREDDNQNNKLREPTKQESKSNYLAYILLVILSLLLVGSIYFYTKKKYQR